MSPYVVLLIGGLLMLALHIIMIDRLCFLGVVQDIFVCIALFSYTVISCILWYCLSHLFFIRPAIIHHPELLSPDAMRMNIKREQVDHAFRNLKSSRDRRNVIIDLDSPSPKKNTDEKPISSHEQVKRPRTSAPSTRSPGSSASMCPGVDHAIPNPEFIRVLIYCTLLTLCWTCVYFFCITCGVTKRTWVCRLRFRWWRISRRGYQSWAHVEHS